jgi:hypothetical protein
MKKGTMGALGLLKGECLHVITYIYRAVYIHIDIYSHIYMYVLYIYIYIYIHIYEEEDYGGPRSIERWGVLYAIMYIDIYIYPYVCFCLYVYKRRDHGSPRSFKRWLMSNITTNVYMYFCFYLHTQWWNQFRPVTIPTRHWESRISFLRFVILSVWSELLLVGIDSITGYA